MKSQKLNFVESLATPAPDRTAINKIINFSFEIFWRTAKSQLSHLVSFHFAGAI